MKQITATVMENTALTERVSRLRFRADTKAIERPGQFVSLSLPGFYLRRPFSVCDWEEGSFSIVYEAVGKGTEQMRLLEEGAALDLLSGLGNGFDLSRAGERPLLVGGGTGASPLLGLARRLMERGIRPHVVLGFKTRYDIFLTDDFYRLGLAPTVCTEDGSFGIRGFVTEGMTIPHSFFYACGPEAMLRAVSLVGGADGQLSFDARMGCGFGACMGCTRMTKAGAKRVCKDGPVFDKEEILWED